MIFETWNPDIQESWNLLDLASVCWLQCIGYFSTQFLSLNLIFNANFQNSITPWIFQELSGILELLLKWTIFCQVQHIEWFSHSIFGLKLHYQFGIPKFLHSWNLLRIIWKWPSIDKISSQNHYVKLIRYPFRQI